MTWDNLMILRYYMHKTMSDVTRSGIKMEYPSYTVSFLLILRQIVDHMYHIYQVPFVNITGYFYVYYQHYYWQTIQS